MSDPGGSLPLQESVGNADYVIPIPALEKIDIGLTKAEKAFSSVIFIIMLTIMVLQVLFRYFLEISAPWMEELIRFLFIMTTFVAGAYVTQDRDHIVIDVIVTFFNRIADPVRRIRTVRIFWLIADAISAALCIFVTLRSNEYTLRMLHTAQKSAAIQMPVWIIAIFIEIGFLLMSIHYVIKFVNMIYTMTRKEEVKEK